MNQKLQKAIFLLTVFAACVLSGCSRPNGTEPSSAPEAFGIDDILVAGKPLVEEKPFMLIDMDDMLSTGHTWKKTESVEHANGFFTYWEADGITCVTHSSGTHLVSLLLNKSGLSLNCGLKVGMKEAEIQSLGLPFERFEKEDLLDESSSPAFASSVLRDEKNPVQTADFDSVYVYVGAIPEEEMTEYGISTTSCVSIVAFLRDGTVSHIMLDMPTAG